MAFLGGRFRLHHLLTLLGLYSLYLLVSTPSAASRAPAPSLSFCPFSTSNRHTPTIILQADGLSARTVNRTYWVGGSRPANFLPYTYPPRDLRIAQSTSTNENGIPPPGTGPGAGHRRGKGNLHSGNEMEEGKQLCSVHRVPSSPPPAVPKGWNGNRVMFGMSTTPDRVLYNLPVWSHWVPASPLPLDPESPQVKDLPLILVLTPPPNPTEEARTREAMDEAQGMGMYVEMRMREADRFETRYFALVEELWFESQRREVEHGIRTEWFVFS